MALHLPINHPLRPLYRTLAGLAGLYIVIFGIVGVVQTRGLGTFARDGLPSVLGLQCNRAFAILSIVVGAVLVIGAIVGGNLDQRINITGGVVFLVAGLAMLTVLESQLNILGFSVATCVVSFLIGMALSLAGLYGRVGSPKEVEREEKFRHGHGPDPQHSHKLTAPNPPHGGETMA